VISNILATLSDRRLQREQRDHPLVEREVEPVDLVVGRDHGLGERDVVVHHRVDRPAHRDAREFAEREQVELHRLELLVERRAGHQPNRPVT
jgi:hypothetical protein